MITVSISIAQARIYSDRSLALYGFPTENGLFSRYAWCEIKNYSDRICVAVLSQFLSGTTSVPESISEYVN